MNFWVQGKCCYSSLFDGTPAFFVNHTIRQQLLTARAQLTLENQQQASHAACQKLIALPLFQNSKHIALYLPAKGELDLSSLPSLATPDQTFYLPCLDDGSSQALGFAPFKAPRHLNRYHLLEPKVSPEHWFAITALDMVLLPLVAFDQAGYRLGMGKGYYDRCFSFLRERTYCSHPILLGAAYAFQEVPTLEHAWWDVPLDGVLSERGVQWFKPFKEAPSSQGAPP